MKRKALKLKNTLFLKNRCGRVARRGAQFFDDLRTLFAYINVRVLKVRLFPSADQMLLILDIRKTLQVLSCKVCGGDSWTRTNGLTSLRSFSQVRNQVEPTSATSMVVTPHCGDHFLSVEKATDEISATGGRRWLSPNRCVHISCDH